MAEMVYQQRPKKSAETNRSQQRSEDGQALGDSKVAFKETAQLEAMTENSLDKQAQRAAMINVSPAMAAQRKVVEGINNSPYVAAQRQKLNSLLGVTAQRVEEEEPVQGKSETAQRVEETAKPNNTGLPDNLKSGIESLSGLSMDNVKVHYNSAKPAQLNALAYAQGTDIHVAPGQEKHLPHEAWHVVQQSQGRVKPTMQMKGGVPVNDDAGLEREADLMGGKAVQIRTNMHDARFDSVSFYSNTYGSRALENQSAAGTMQRMKVVPEDGCEEKLGKGKTLNQLKLLVQVMSAAVRGVPGKDDTIIIEIINNGEMSPAWNHHKGTEWHSGKSGDIGVELNKWYLEKASLGDLIGMFIHEIGVHTLADRLMGAEKGGTEGKEGSEFIVEYCDQSNDHENQIGGTIESFSDETESAKRRSRQRDHVNLAKSLSGGKSTRAKHYINLYLATGDALNGELDGKGKDDALRDLTQSFLFDIARLAATDDGPAVALFWNTENIGQLMTYYQKNILEPEEDAHKWLKKAATGIESGKWQIRGWLLKQIGALALSSNPAVQKIRPGVMGLLAGGAALATGAAIVPALLTGLAVGTGVYLVQKIFGF